MAIRSCNLKKDSQYYGQKKKYIRTMFYNTLHRKLKIEEEESHKKLRVNSGVLEG
jgi:hypothetical protein